MIMSVKIRRYRAIIIIIIVVVKNQEESSLRFVNICFRSRDMSFQNLGNLAKNAKRKLLAYWGVENEIIVFLINEGWNPECCHGNKMFCMLELLV